MGTTEGLKWLVEQWEGEERNNAMFLKERGWIEEDGYWIKGNKKLRAFDTDHAGAVSTEIGEMSTAAGWRQITIETLCNDKQDRYAYYVSPKTNRMYHWFEMMETLYSGISEEDLKLCGKTEDLNRLFPGKKPDLIKVEFGKFDGVYGYRLLV